MMVFVARLTDLYVLAALIVRIIAAALAGFDLPLMRCVVAAIGLPALAGSLMLLGLVHGCRAVVFIFACHE
jgi:hypothetical protein